MADTAQHDEIMVKDVSEGSLEAQVAASEEKSDLKLDQYGFALVPQPTNFKDDPLVRFDPFPKPFLRCRNALGF